LIVDLPLLALLLLGGWAALDGTSVGQFLIGRPLFAGTLAGALLGDLSGGFLIGALLELISLAGVPAGGVRLSEPGPAAIPAVVALHSLGGASGGGIALSLALGVAWGQVGGASMVLLRHANGRVMRGTSALDLPLRHWSCIGLDLLRGLLLTAVGVGLALRIPGGWIQLWPLSTSLTLALCLLPATLEMGVVLRRWIRNREGWALLGVSAGAGIFVGLWVL